MRIAHYLHSLRKRRQNKVGTMISTRRSVNFRRSSRDDSEMDNLRSTRSPKRGALVKLEVQCANICSMIIALCLVGMLSNRRPLEDIGSISYDTQGKVTVEVPKISNWTIDKTSISAVAGKSVKNEKALVKTLTPKDVDWNDTIFFSEENEWDNSPIVIESHKLLFFTVPKNSCSEWKKLFRRMMGYSDWNKIDPHDPQKNGLRYLDSYSKDQQAEFMTSPDWTRAIFLRDPLERALSAYLNKRDEYRFIYSQCCKPILHNNTNLRIDGEDKELTKMRYAMKKECQTLGRQLLTPKLFPFDMFVRIFMYPCNNAHWRPQSSRMSMKNWKTINFIGRFEHIQEDARILLQNIGAYDEFAATGWGKGGKNAIFERNFASHSTSAHERMKKMYSPELKQITLQYLKSDYEHPHFNFTIP